MWYYGTVTRGNQTFYLVSPAYGRFTLSPEKKGTYLFMSQASAREEIEKHVQSGDVVKIVRTYIG